MKPLRAEVRTITLLALPAVATQLGNIALLLVDQYLVGRLGPESVAAVGLGGVVVFGSLILGMGLVMGIDPLVSQAHGAGKGDDVALALQRGIVVALLVTPPIALIWWCAEPILLFAGQSPNIAALSGQFCRAQVFGVAPFLVFVALRSYLQARGITITPVIVMLLANVFNALAGWSLIFGHFGLPALGVQGAGISTGLSRVFMMLAMIALIVRFRQHDGAWVAWSRASFSRAGIAAVMHTGIPVALHIGLEIWAFSGSGLIVGWLGERSMAAHTIVMRIASTTFMVPLGISFATAMRVGNLIGAGDRAGAARAAWCGIAIGGGFMLCAGFAILMFGEQVCGVFIDDSVVIATALTLLPLTAAFQLCDGVQAVACGVLRGMGTARPAAVINFVGYYLIGLPLGAWLALPWGLNLGVRGIWWSFVIGLTAVASLFLAWIYYRGPNSRS